ncbi:tripartite tricarboxylate transporter TctB family protein [Tropicimonas sp. IMCC34011]|uniref:tripartite tricarboxylate transporter TctB family protein n=1 Tax=Tropicimonas sp. IMCC34011 TaxID=2248759 RepID=UPI001300B421|nr:tripartite tricarboxylate transporter TctB family protein [Tropicimonas sp. IMCC34011]
MTGAFRTNRLVGVVLTAATGGLCLFLWLRPWTHEVLRDGFTLGFFPLIGAGAMLICAALMIVDPLRREVPEGLEDVRWSDVGIAAMMLLGIGIYAVLMRRWGFVTVTPVFLLVYMWWLGVRPLHTALALAVALPIAIYALFTLLGVSLPKGVLAFIL